MGRPDRSSGLLAAVLGLIALITLGLAVQGRTTDLSLAQPSPSTSPATAVQFCQRVCSSPLPCPTLIPTAQPVVGPGGVIVDYQCPEPQQ